MKSAGLKILGVVAACLAVLWVIQVEYVHASIQVGNASPPIPALTAVLVLGTLAALVARRRRRREVDRRSVLWTYILITFAAGIPSTASLTFLFAYITTPAYLAKPESDMVRIVGHFPRWYALPPGEAVRRFYDGGHVTGQGIPWNLWVGPLLAWGGFLFVLLLSLYAVLVLLRRSWMESERLAYPMVQIPLRVAGAVSEGQKPIWRLPVFWIGFLVTVLYDGINMLHTFYPTVPPIGIGVDIGAWLVEKPWSVLSPLWVSYRPEIVGIAYLMPTPVLLTTWVSYLSLRLWSVLRFAYGYPVVSTAYDYQELGIGAFLCLFVLLLWRARRDLEGSLREALGRVPPAADRDEPLSARTAWLLAVGGPLLMLVWLSAAGLPVWLASAYLLLVIAVAVVYARMRAETGTPSIYLFPFWQQQNLLLNLFGSAGLSGGSERTLTLFVSLGGLARGYYPELCVYGAEGMSVATQGRLPQRRVSSAALLGILLGLGLGGYLYLHAAYTEGVNQLGGRYQVQLAQQQYNQLLQMLSSPTLPKVDLVVQTAAGAGIVLALQTLRLTVLWFPFHPMGFAMASAYGYHLWAPFLVVWIAKSLILRYGGHAGYRFFVPFFLGLALGRYLFTGIIWGLLAVTGHEAVQSYMIHFS